MPGIRFWFQWPAGIVNGSHGANKAETGPKPAAGADFFASGGGNARGQERRGCQCSVAAGSCVHGHDQGIDLGASRQHPGCHLMDKGPPGRAGCHRRNR